MQRGYVEVEGIRLGGRTAGPAGAQRRQHRLGFGGRDLGQAMPGGEQFVEMRHLVRGGQEQHRSLQHQRRFGEAGRRRREERRATARSSCARSAARSSGSTWRRSGRCCDSRPPPRPRSVRRGGLRRDGRRRWPRRCRRRSPPHRMRACPCGAGSTAHAPAARWRGVRCPVGAGRARASPVRARWQPPAASPRRRSGRPVARRSAGRPPTSAAAATSPAGRRC